MGIFGALTGNAGDVSIEEVRQELGPLLGEDETVEAAFRIIRDMHVFTSKRLIIVDKQGLRGTKVEYTSIPYRAIVRFSTENAGSFDLDSEVKIWTTGAALPIAFELKRGADLVGLQKALARFVLR